MKIIIAGAGEVGFHLAKLLSYESLDITLIDIDRDRLNYAEGHLDIKTLRGNASSLALLKESDVAESDLFIAVTGLESVNITVSILAKQLGSKKTIARTTTFPFEVANGVNALINSPNKRRKHSEIRHCNFS